MRQWIKDGSIISHWNPIDSQPSGLHVINFKAWNSTKVGWKDYGISILKCTWYKIHQLSFKREKNINSDY